MGVARPQPAKLSRMIVIGAGRVGGALSTRARLEHVPCTLVDRAHGWEALQRPAGEPVVLTVRNDDLDAVRERIPQHRRADLVFVQNGMIRDWLAKHQLQDATRGLLFFAVPSRGAPIETGPANPFWGPHAAALVEWFGQLGLPAEALDTRAFAIAELEKLLWNSCFGLLCERFDADVGTVVREHADTLGALVLELLPISEPAFELSLAMRDREAMLERMRSYAARIPTNRASVKEWPWRNGWFVGREPTPLHRELLEVTGHWPHG
jgi:ketopantoate reductase